MNKKDTSKSKANSNSCGQNFRFIPDVVLLCCCCLCCCCPNERRRMSRYWVVPFACGSKCEYFFNGWSSVLFLKDLTIKTRQSLRQKVYLFVGITYPMTSERIDGSSSRAQAAWLVWKIVFVPESRQIYFGILFFAQEKN